MLNPDSALTDPLILTPVQDSGALKYAYLHNRAAATLAHRGHDPVAFGVYLGKYSCGVTRCQDLKFNSSVLRVRS